MFHKYNQYKLLRILPFVMLAVVLASCTRMEKTYTIGVSLDKDDQWRQKLTEELMREALQHPDLRLVWCQSYGNNEHQGEQIDSLAGIGVDLLMVSTDAPDAIREHVDKAFDAGVPVVVTSKGKSEKYTALVGTDNYAVGAQLARCLTRYAQTNGYTAAHQLEAIEICGLPTEDSPRLRHSGLVDSLSTHSEVKLAGWANGDWEEELTLAMTDSLLAVHPSARAIVAHNDIMARAAGKAAQTVHPGAEYYILGVDAIADGGEGLESIISGAIDASVSNVSRGDLMIQTAYAILKHQPYARDYYVDLEIVDRSSQQLMMRLAKELVAERNAVRTVESKTDEIGKEAGSLKVTVIVLVIGLMLALSLLVFVMIFSYRRHQRQSESRKNSMLASQQKQIDSIYAELEKVKTTAQEATDDFMEQFQKAVIDHLSDSGFTVEELSKELGLSRAQLFRKVKQQTGESPLELIRRMRMQKANQLLQTTQMTVQQVADAVGFQSASYFSNLYKKQFGKLPKEAKGERQ